MSDLPSSFRELKVAIADEFRKEADKRQVLADLNTQLLAILEGKADECDRLQARVAELEAALEAASEVAGFIRRRAVIDPDAVNHATLAGIHNGAMRIEQIAADALKAGADHE